MLHLFYAIVKSIVCINVYCMENNVIQAEIIN